MARLYGVIQEPLDRLAYRLTGGATTASSWLAGVDIAMLTTTGARSGRPRTLPVLGLREGEDTILIASNFGRPRNPAWCHNLRANPRATIAVDGVSRDVLAHELHGAERERGYRRGEEIFPGFTQYRRWTDRKIPVFRACPTRS
jgi:deazaflavin-dependent oxidoreductase (nitroreductase family)